MMLAIFLLMIGSFSFADSKKNCLNASRSSQNNTVTVCEKALMAATNIDEKSIILITKAEYLIRNNQFRAADSTLDLAFNSNPKMLENGVFRLNWMRTKGSLYINKEEFKAALVYYQQALDVAVSMNNQTSLANSYNDLGAIYQHLGLYEESLIWLNKSLSVHQVSEDHYRSALTLANIGEVLESQKQYKKSIDYYKRALAQHKSNLIINTNKSEFFEPYQAQVNLSLGNVYLKIGRLEKAEENFNLALKNFKKHQLKGQQIKTMSKIGALYLTQKKSDKALEILNDADAIDADQESQEYVGLKVNLTKAYIATEQWAQAEKTALMAIEMSQKKGNFESEANLLKLLSDLLEKRGDTSKALHYFRLHHKIMKEHSERSFSESGLKLQSQIDYKQSQFEIKQLEAFQARQKLQIQNQRWYGVILVLLITALVIYFLLSLRKKDRIKLQSLENRASHSQKLNELSYNSLDFDLLFQGLACTLLCFDVTGKIHHYQGFEKSKIKFNKLNLQTVCSNSWNQLSLDINSEDTLQKDIIVKSNERIDSEVLPKQSIWFHQLPYLDGLIVGVFIPEANDNQDGYSNAEKIKKHSEFKVLLEKIARNSNSLPISKIGDYSLIISAFKSLKKQDSDHSYNNTELREMGIILMNVSLELWQLSTKTGAVELAEKSGLWRVSIDDGRLRIRTLRKYLSLDNLPKYPRWQQITKTAHFVLSECDLDMSSRQRLNQLVSEFIRATRSQSQPYKKAAQ